MQLGDFYGLYIPIFELNMGEEEPEKTATLGHLLGRVCQTTPL